MIVVRDPRVLHAAFQSTTHTPWLVEFLEEWRLSELDKLPYAKEDFAVRQGRVQALDEVVKMFRNAEIDLKRLKT